MKRILVIFISVLLLMVCLIGANAEQMYGLSGDGYMQGHMTIDGHKIDLDALFDAKMPKQLKNITHKATELTHSQLRAVIDAYFDTLDDFDHKWSSSPKGTYLFQSLRVPGKSPSRRVMADYH